MRRFSSLLLLPLLLAGCPGGGPTAKPPTTKPLASATTGAKVVGTIAVPAGILSNANGALVAAGGGNLIGNDAAGLVAAGGGNLVAAGGGNLIGNDAAGYQLTAVTAQALAGVKVYLCDASYRPLPGVPPVTTDAQGRYTLPAVPPGIYLVATATQTADGKPAPLLTIVKVGGAGATADVDLATSFVAVVMTEGRSGGLAAIDPASAGYRRATAATARSLSAGDIPTLADPAGMLARMEALAAEVAEVKEGLAAMGREVADLKAQLAAVLARLNNTGAGGGALVTGPFVPPATATVLAGGDAAGYVDGAGAAARFGEPTAPVWLNDGRVLVADAPNHALRLIAPDGTVTTVAGLGPTKPGYFDGPKATGLLSGPTGLAIEIGPKTSFFVADGGNHVLRGLTLDDQGGAALVTAAGTGQVGTNDEGDPGPALMRNPVAVAVARDGTPFVVDREAASLRYMRAGKLMTAKLTGLPLVEPVGVAAPTVERIYVADAKRNVVFRLKATAPLTYVVDELGTFQSPQGLAIAPNGMLLVVERTAKRISVVDPDTGKVTHTIGSPTAAFGAPTGVVAGAGGAYYVTDTSPPRVWKLTP